MAELMVTARPDIDMELAHKTNADLHPDMHTAFANQSERTWRRLGRDLNAVIAPGLMDTLHNQNPEEESGAFGRVVEAFIFRKGHLLDASIIDQIRNGKRDEGAKQSARIKAFSPVTRLALRPIIAGMASELEASEGDTVVLDGGTLYEAATRLGAQHKINEFVASYTLERADLVVRTACAQIVSLDLLRAGESPVISGRQHAMTIQARQA